MTTQKKWNSSKWQHEIIPQDTFDAFIVSNQNQLAYEAARMMANNLKTKSHAPLLIYGGIGLGKTHLLHAIGNHAQVADMNTCYASAETFTNGFIAALQENQLSAFRELYRTCDLLLIDDIDYLSEKTRLTSEIVFTLKYLLLNQTPVAITSNSHPAKTAGFSEELLSLLGQGLIVPIEPPDQYERRTILQKKAEAMELEIDPVFIEYLAIHSDGDIRKMEGMLMQVAFLKQHLNKRKNAS